VLASDLGAVLALEAVATMPELRRAAPKPLVTVAGKGESLGDWMSRGF
jgi:hypothetical protein